MIISLESDGTVTYMGDLPFELPLTNQSRRRVSVIQPSNLLKRRMFLFLRCVAGETGRVAAWTRTWAGPWRAVILATGQSATFNTRAEAITWEIQTLDDQ